MLSEISIDGLAGVIKFGSDTILSRSAVSILSANNHIMGFEYAQQTDDPNDFANWFSSVINAQYEGLPWKPKQKAISGARNAVALGLSTLRYSDLTIINDDFYAVLKGMNRFPRFGTR